jgi:hypothetical protein
MAQTFSPVSGDLLVESSSSIVLEPAGDSTKRVTITSAKISASNMVFDKVNLNSSDLSTRIDNIKNKPGVGDSNVETSHILNESVETRKFALIPVAKGGTGLSSVGPDEVLFAVSGNKVESSTNLKADGDGLYLNGTLELTNTTNSAKFYESVVDLVVDIDGTVTNLGLANRGSPPKINGVTIINNTLTFDLQDPDGDLRSLHLIWYDAQKWPTHQNVFEFAAKGVSSFDSPVGSAEIDLFDAINTGSDSFQAVFPGASLQGKYIYAVAEDGPGNLSDVKEYFWT